MGNLPFLILISMLSVEFLTVRWKPIDADAEIKTSKM